MSAATCVSSPRCSLFTCVDPAVLLLTAGDRTMIYRVATATSLGPHGVASAFLAVALALTPFLAFQCGCWPERVRGITQLTCLALSTAALLWFFLAWRCLTLDFGDALVVLLARNGAGSMLFALALALSLNADQLRKR
jgi:hypothetical protein